jgi:hypothetical protein
MNQNNPHWDIFLSHSSKDKPNVERLARDLKEAGASVWLDVWEMSIGDPLTRSIQAGLKNSRYVGIWITKEPLIKTA